MKMSKIKNLKKIVDLILLISSVFSISSILAIYGFYITPENTKFIINFQHIIALIFIFGIGVNFFNAKSKILFFKKYPIQIFITIIFLIILIYQTIKLINHPYQFEPSRYNFTNHDFFILVLHIFIFISSIISIAKFRDFWLLFPLRTSRIFVLSFFFVIVIGAVLLKLPKASNDLAWIDAFFLATSAVCVTGLSPVDISNVLNFEGQVILLGLIQIGGLGIITLTTFVAVFMQKGFRLKDQILLTQMMDDEELNSISTMLVKIIGITFVIETLGAICLYYFWADFSFSNFDRVFNAIFHAVSAYCNAGFSNYSIGMESPVFAGHAPTLIVIMMLIIFGGIGFYSMNYIFFNKNKNKNQGIKLQTRIILITTIVLIFGGALVIWLLQYNEWKDLPFKQQLLNSFFLSVTSRTAGFANVNIGNILVPTIMVVIFLMYIGAAPNSTAGGIKITTFVTLLFGVWAFIRGKDRVEIGWNSINMMVVRRSLVVFFISISLIFVASFGLVITENLLILGGKKSEFLDVIFETVSAFGTVGLSRGITPFLSSLGKMILICVMFFGRVGLFTIAVAIGEEKYHAKYKYPETNIMVG